MGSIYRKAKAVVVWLGDEDDFSAIAISALDNLSSRRGMQQAPEATNVALVNFFSRPWFSRVWVVQEFSPGRDVTFMCGQHSFRWEKIEQMLEVLIKKESAHMRLNQDRPGQVFRKLMQNDNLAEAFQGPETKSGTVRTQESETLWV